MQTSTYSIIFIHRSCDAQGNPIEDTNPYVEFPLDLMESFEGLTMESSLKEFVAKWKESLDTANT